MTHLSRLLCSAVAIVFLDVTGASSSTTDLEVIDRALTEAKPGAPWVTFGDVGIKYADLAAYRDRLAGVPEATNPGVVTPPGTTFTWPGGNVYYRFDPAQLGNGTITPLKMQQFRDGVAEWAAFANLHFIENISGQPHYITVQEDPAMGGGFSSSVGMDPANAEQFVKFGPWAWNRGTICHEVGHALGLWHEQQRPDRDSYIVINWNNMDPWQQPNFAIISGGGTQGTGYDFYSVMHYRRDALSNNGQDTIGMQPAYAQYLDVIGTVYDRTLSQGDRAGIATIYGNPASLPGAVVTNTNDGGPGSLRTAIYFAFDKSTDVPPVPTTITFQIPTSDSNYGSGTGVFTIKPTSILTALGSGTTIDGASQGAFTGNTNPNGPELVLDGSIFALLQGPLGIYAPGVTLRASGCVIRGLTITNFNQSGVVLFQGADPNGSATTGNVIGGTTASARNVISGNAEYGISLRDATTTGNVIQGNSIGTDQSGAVAQPNGYSGIVINLGAHGNTIGGTAPGAGNVISGNTYQGIFIGGAGSNANLVQGNVIGTDAAGTVAVPNIVGVAIADGAQSNTIGGAAGGARNVISGNTYQGLTIDGAATRLNTVAGNYFGLDATGTTQLANNSTNLAIFSGAHDNTIGGTIAGSRNFICGSPYYGISIDGTGTNGNLVQGNTIGLNVAGISVANGFHGVAVYGAAQSNTIGGLAVGASNTISGNTYDGVALFDATTSNIRISQNSIFANPFSGIALNGGSNNSQPAPALSSAVLGPAGNLSGVDVSGTLTGSAANTSFRIEFFASPPGNDEGQFFVGSANVLTNGSGTATFTAPPVHLAAAVPKNYVITATATDPGGSTSRFSSPFSVSSTDTDSDGMPDAWEGLHLFNPGSSADAGIDSDVDGFTNLQEFQDGTDPRSPSSRLMIVLDRSAGDPRIGFQALAGKTYRLEYRDDLVAGNWRPLVNGIFSPVTATVQLVDADALGVTKRHYLVRVEP